MCRGGGKEKIRGFVDDGQESEFGQGKRCMVGPEREQDRASTVDDGNAFALFRAGFDVGRLHGLSEASRLLLKGKFYAMPLASHMVHIGGWKALFLRNILDERGAITNSRAPAGRTVSCFYLIRA